MICTLVLKLNVFCKNKYVYFMRYNHWLQLKKSAHILIFLVELRLHILNILVDISIVYDVINTSIVVSSVSLCNQIYRNF
jgi:hypothetical protein